MVFVVRQDMLPVKCQNSISQSSTKTETRGQFSLRIEMTSNLTIGVVSGTYGDALDPNFDVGTGPPDMVVALNAGLYAYESWRSVSPISTITRVWWVYFPTTMNIVVSIVPR